MNKEKFFKTRLYFTCIITIAIGALLAWDHYHGGVPSHHLLANKDLPAVSNWWGGLLIPFLTGLLTYRIQRRAFNNNIKISAGPNVLVGELYGFAGALVFGISLSAFFTFGYPDVCGYMILGLLAFAVFYPIYRTGCLLGFVIGMTFTFGAVLPTAIGCIIGLLGLILYRFIQPGILYVVSKLAPMVSLNKQKPGL
jgi:hypothetical protein